MRIIHDLQKSALSVGIYELDRGIAEAVAGGDTNALGKVIMPLSTAAHYAFSDNPVKDMRYLFVIFCVLTAKCCCENGMKPEQTYKICDYYISAGDKCSTEQQLERLYSDMLFDYTIRMRRTARDKIYSKHTSAALDYISGNMTKKIRLTDIAALQGITSSYLSRIFCHEVGVSPNEYIARKRVEAAENMLKFSDYSPIDIGNYLAFCSHSHFISTFKKYTGVTPKQYREKCYAREWRK